MAELKELGIDEEQIERMLTMPAMGERPTGQALGPGGEMRVAPGGAAAGDMNARSEEEPGGTISTAQLYNLGGWAGLLLAGLLLAWLFKRRKYRS